MHLKKANKRDGFGGPIVRLVPFGSVVIELPKNYVIFLPRCADISRIETHTLHCFRQDGLFG
jgi:hypothetical protein